MTDVCLTANTPVQISELPASGRRRPSTTVTLLKLVAGLAIMLLLLRFIDVKVLLHRLGSVEPAAIVAMVAILVVQVGVFAFRLHLIGRCMGKLYPFAQAVLATFELSFVTQILPTALAGDAVRVMRGHRSGLAWSAAVSVVFVDRVIGLLSLVLLAPVLFVLLPPTGWSDPFLVWIGLVLVAFLGATLVLYLLAPVVQRFEQHRIIAVLAGLSRAFRAFVRTKPDLAIGAFLTSLLGHSLTALTLARAAEALGLHLPLLAAVPASALMMVFSLAPVSIGGWGVRDGAAVMVFGLFGIARSDALSVSILFGLATTLVGLLGALVWIFARDGRRKAVIE